MGGWLEIVHDTVFSRMACAVRAASLIKECRKRLHIASVFFHNVQQELNTRRAAALSSPPCDHQITPFSFSYVSPCWPYPPLVYASQNRRVISSPLIFPQPNGRFPSYAISSSTHGFPYCGRQISTFSAVRYRSILCRLQCVIHPLE